MDNLSKKLLIDACHSGLCDEFRENWRPKSVGDFVEFYKIHANWCMERKYPSFHMMLQYFNTEEVRQHDVFVNQHQLSGLISTFPRIYNNCSGELFVMGYSVVVAYVSLSSNLVFNIGERGSLTIEYYDDAEIHVNTSGRGKCTIYQYGSVAPIVTGDNVKIIDKRNG